MTTSTVPTLLLWGIGAVFLCALLVVAGLLLRHAALYRRIGGVDCSLRRVTAQGREQWHRGRLRLGSDRLRWFGPVSLRPGPDAVFRRAEIVELVREPLSAASTGERDTLVLIRLREGAQGRFEEIEARVGRPAAAALTAWIEAAPTGLVLGDAD